MKTEEARRMLDAARAQATSMGRAVTVVIVDATGIPVVLERIGAPPAFTAVIAEGKAAASAFMGRDSVQLQGMTERSPAIVSALVARLGGRFVAHQGAVVLMRDGDVAGAVGVSGASAEEDEQIAKAGAAVFGA